MKIYNYDSLTFEYLGSDDAFESPLEPGVFLAPANSTTIELPTTTESNHTFIFNNGAWVSTPDFRGTVVYNTSTLEPSLISEFGPLPDNVTTIEPPSATVNWMNGAWVENNTTIILTIQNAISVYRDQLMVTNGFNVADKWYASDSASRTQLLGLAAAGANIPVNLQWKTMDGSYVTMTAELASQILVTAIASDNAIFEYGETQKANVANSATPSTYDWKTGWPVGYTPVVA